MDSKLKWKVKCLFCLPAEQTSSFERRKKSAKQFLHENKEWEQEVILKDVGPVVSINISKLLIYNNHHVYKKI